MRGAGLLVVDLDGDRAPVLVTAGKEVFCVAAPLVPLV